MSDPSTSRAKLVFVLSNDYGELSNALYLVTGYGFRTTLLMPDRLFQLNQVGLSASACRYQSVADVLDAVDRHQPDVVFLFSGYLLAINRIFDLGAISPLVQGLRSRGCRVVTSDPFLGLLSTRGNSPFSDQHPLKGALTDHFAALATVFHDVTHLYLVPPGTWAPPGSISFFNPNITCPLAPLEARNRLLADRLGLDPTKRPWLFVLSLEDYVAQARLHGGDRFDALLAAVLRSTGREGRQPVLVGPPPCLASLTGGETALGSARLLGFCGQDLFLPLLLGAEYAFYWNVFSNSVLTRAVNRLPVFFFDRGHLARAIPPLFDAGLHAYYPGAHLPYLDLHGGLESERLAQLATRQDQELEAARVRLRQSLTPEVMVEALLREGGDRTAATAARRAPRAGKDPCP